MFVKTLKLYHSDEEHTDINAEFIREVALLSMLATISDFVVLITEFDPTNTTITTEYIPFTLDKYMSLNSYITLLEMKDIMYQILLGLKHLRDLDIIHRDIKPENIMITHDKNVKLIDFGISAYNYKHFTDYDRVQTEGYKSPESYLYWPFDEDNELLRFDKLDVWSLGIILIDFMYKTKEAAFDVYEPTLDYILYYAYVSTGEIDELHLSFIEKLYTRLDGDPIFIASSLRLYAPEYQQILIHEGYMQTIRGLHGVDMFNYASSIHPLSEQMKPIISQMLVFSPRSRYSVDDLLLDPFFVDVRDRHQSVVYNTYRPEVKDIYLGDRESVISQMVGLCEFMEAKYIHLLNAIYILDKYHEVKSQSGKGME